MYTLAVIFVIFFVIVNVLTIAFLVFQEMIQDWVRKRFIRHAQSYVRPALRKHFRCEKDSDLYIVSRSFQKMTQIELYREIQHFLEGKNVVRTSAIEPYGIPSLNDCLVDENREFMPLKYNEVNIGEEKPIRCLNNVLYLWHEDTVPMALLLIQYGTPPMLHVDIAIPKKCQTGPEIEQIMRRLEESIKGCESYRHKIISFEASSRDLDVSETEIKVHHLRQVSREQLILPEKTIDLLERNLLHFVERRHQLRERGMPTKKGILLWGPPGTGKTHTLHYIIGQLKKEYTTFLVTAEQIKDLGIYCQLARLMEPAIIILEDVDVIARERGSSDSETALNKLLNEMDGMNEDSDLIFLLTTNRPDELEEAIRNRPGRIDQAIEFPKPDKAGRTKLALLYASGTELPTAEAEAIAARTEGASAAFIKELLRHSAQFLLERDEKSITFVTADWENALKEMLTGSSFGVFKLSEADKFIL